MKKWPLLIIILCFLFLCSCNSSAYDRGYESGYAHGFSDGRGESLLEHADDYVLGYNEGRDEGYDDGYDTGYEDAKSELISIVQNARDEASAGSDWGLYEAWNSAYLYLGSPNPYEYDIPTQQELKEILECLAKFAEYLDESNAFDF